MIEFGNLLRTAREAKGFSIGQLAEQTHLAPTTIQELETENFSRIAAPIYGRGFIKLYCEAVNLDPKPLIAEFMDIYNGNHDPAIRERARPEPAADPAEPDGAAVATAEPTAASAESAGAGHVPAKDPDPVVEAEPPPQAVFAPTNLAPAADLFNQEHAPAPPDDHTNAAPTSQPEPPLSRYAAPVRQACPTVDFRSYLRLGFLALVAIALLILLFSGIRAVYRATTKTHETLEPENSAIPAAAPEKTPDKTEKAHSQEKGPPADRKTARTPQKIPSLYID